VVPEPRQRRLKGLAPEVGPAASGVTFPGSVESLLIRAPGQSGNPIDGKASIADLEIVPGIEPPRSSDALHSLRGLFEVADVASDESQCFQVAAAKAEMPHFLKPRLVAQVVPQLDLIPAASLETPGRIFPKLCQVKDLLRSPDAVELILYNDVLLGALAEH